MILNIHMRSSPYHQTILQWVALSCCPETILAVNWSLFVKSRAKWISLRNSKCFLVSVKFTFLILEFELAFWIFYALNDVPRLFQSMSQMLLLYCLWFESCLFGVATSAGVVSLEEALVFAIHSWTCKITKLLFELWGCNRFFETLWFYVTKSKSFTHMLIMSSFDTECSSLSLSKRIVSFLSCHECWMI